MRINKPQEEGQFSQDSDPTAIVFLDFLVFLHDFFRLK
jgi:hypothetical protein